MSAPLDDNQGQQVSEEDVVEEEGVTPSGIEEVDLAQATQTLDAYVQCLRDPLDGYIQVNLERFAGVQEEYQLPDGSDNPDRIDRERARCAASTGFDEVMDVFAQSHPSHDDDASAASAEFASCLASVDAGLEARIASSQPGTFAEISRTYDEMMNELLAAGSNTAQDVTECFDGAVFGPKYEF